MDKAESKEIVRLDEQIEITRAMLTKFVLKNDYLEKFRKVETEIWDELATKLEKNDFNRKIDSFEEE